MTEEAAMFAIEGLRGFRFFPKDNAFLEGIISEELFKMCPSIEAAKWLVKRAYTLWNGEWKGPKELRALLCSKYRPADGNDVFGSELFPDGIIPPEIPLPESPPMKALPPGALVSTHTGFDAAVQKAAGELATAPTRDLPPEVRKRAHEFDKVLEEVLTPPEDRAPLPRPKPAIREEEPSPVPEEKRIAQQDITAAIAEKPDRKKELIAEARRTIEDPEARTDEIFMAKEKLRGLGGSE